MKTFLCLPIMGLFLLTALSSGCSSKNKDSAIDTGEVVQTPEVTEPVEAPVQEPAPTEPVMPAETLEQPVQGSDDYGFPDITGTERIAATCSLNGDQREIAVLDITGNNGCGVVYTKNGTKKTIAIARNDMSYCDQVFEKVKGNLEGSGFDCGGGVASPSSTGASSSEPPRSSTISEKTAQAMDSMKEKASAAVKSAEQEMVDKENDVVEVQKSAEPAAKTSGSKLSDAAAQLKKSATETIQQHDKNNEDARLKKMGE